MLDPNNEPDGSKWMVKNPEEQKIIARIIELHKEGLSRRAICRRLDFDELKPRWKIKRDQDGNIIKKERSKWNHSLIASILQDAGLVKKKRRN